MPSAVVNAYVETLPEVLAQRQLDAAETSLLPYVKPHDRKKVIGRWTRRAGGRAPTATFFGQLARVVKVKEVPRG